jgi:myo-inositol 2-dehydrogenase/D-chiro-inositol 1-dehydrogenase
VGPRRRLVSGASALTRRADRPTMPQPPRDSDPSHASNLSRRRFLANASAAAGFTILGSDLVRASTANSTVDLGVIGCGGRGTWIADLFKKHGGYTVVAAADYFQDRVDAFGEKVGVPAAKRFTGLAGYRRLLEQKLDAVAIISPPYFHPAQAADAVDAGRHVYLAKPVAVDVPGCTTIAESGRRATASRQVFLVDFQTRANEFFIEALRRVHQGALGRFAFGEATYHAEDPFLEKHDLARSGDAEGRLRAWGLFRDLSGDIITEQNIHTLDVVSWIMGGPPVSAYGTGGRKVRDVGTCWDTFSLVFTYPGAVGVTFSSRQFNGQGTRPEGIRARMFGADGVLETEYGGQVLVRGKDFYRGGETSTIYEQGAVTNIETFHDHILKGHYGNDTVEDSVQSTLLTILGRTAAYENREVTWEEVLRRNERFAPDLVGLTD